MKKIVLLNVLLAVLMAAGAQTDSTGYKSIFGRESTVWNGAVNNTVTKAIWRNYELRTASDTLIGDYTYTKIEHYYYDRHGEYYSHIPCRDFYVREDTTRGRVWVRYTEEAIESGVVSYNRIDSDMLVMDMSLEIGDSVFLCRTVNFGVFPQWFYVSSVVYDEDSTKHIFLNDWAPEWAIMSELPKRIITFSQAEFIDGIANLTRNMLEKQIDNAFTCCHKDGVLVYRDIDTNYFLNNDSSCVVYERPYVGIYETDSAEAVSIFPNPCTD